MAQLQAADHEVLRINQVLGVAHFVPLFLWVEYSCILQHMLNIPLILLIGIIANLGRRPLRRRIPRKTFGNHAAQHQINNLIVVFLSLLLHSFLLFPCLDGRVDHCLVFGLRVDEEVGCTAPANLRLDSIPALLDDILDFLDSVAVVLCLHTYKTSFKIRTCILFLLKFLKPRHNNSTRVFLFDFDEQAFEHEG